ncbi:NAD-dependent epimerase/dehydratase family protein [Ktedonosporobacter rubrisoli]|uniref:NAD-dependent epimerase/dehydratase family protein n=1 Tax=Ktedonosporobacter rubrisoli TaxID=2509675 RepID=A0A4V0YYJ1_KTERU|nr:NAD-dependent epimerase/dehydratase family protein [Ktedonosporobacter rubrisoli]QBD76401.1 NAD-dependent epimerase/dehydratase family protein [Ktedonosporobacter rubrisoli]
MHIFVIGATGALGRVLLPRLQQDQHKIHTLVRSAEQAKDLQARGVVASVGELLSPEGQRQLPELARDCEAVIHIATAIPANPSLPGAWDTNTRLRTEGTRALLAAALQAGATRYIQQSIVMAYPDGGDRWLDEEQPLDTTPERTVVCAPVIEMERQVKAVAPGRMHWTILRGGLFVGAGTGQERLLENLRAGQVEIPGNGQNFVSLVHVADVAEAFALALERAPVSSTYNIVDQPLRYGDYVTTLARKLNLPTPPYNSALPEQSSFRCSNQLAKEQLGWQPQHSLWPGEPGW